MIMVTAKTEKKFSFWVNFTKSPFEIVKFKHIEILNNNGGLVNFL